MNGLAVAVMVRLGVAAGGAARSRLVAMAATGVVQIADADARDTDRARLAVRNWLTAGGVVCADVNRNDFAIVADAARSDVVTCLPGS